MMNLIKKLIWYLNGGYKPKEFWNDWAKTFMSDSWQVQTHPQHAWILKKIKKINPKNILEVGCGFGRNIKFLRENGILADITGVDISIEMIKLANKYLQGTKAKLITADTRQLPFEDKEFETVFVHGLLMHVKKTDVENAIKEMQRVCSKGLIDIEQNYNGNEFTFVHDYKKLYRKNGFKVLEYKRNKKLGLDYIYAQVR